jgi:hypothetical protein
MIGLRMTIESVGGQPGAHQERCRACGEAPSAHAVLDTGNVAIVAGFQGQRAKLRHCIARAIAA